MRRQCYTGKQIAIEADVSPATVSRILRRIGLNRLSAQVIGREESQRHDLSQGGSRQAGRSDPARHDRQRLLLSSRAIAKACKRLSLKHIRIKPYTPKTNDKAERFIQTSLHEWAICPRLQHLKRTRRRNLRGWPASMNRRRTAPACARRAPCGVHGCADDVRLAAITRCRRSTSQSEPGQACGRRQSGDADRPKPLVARVRHLHDKEIPDHWRAA